MELVTALLPLALATFIALNWLLLVTSGKVTFSVAGTILYGLILLAAMGWAIVILRRTGTR